MLRGFVAALLSVCQTSVAALAEAPADVEQLYIIECGRCHGPVARDPLDTTDKAGPYLPAMMPVFGPNLIDIVGRPAGIVESFAYSSAFRAATQGLIWTERNLDRLMTDSRTMIPGSFMFYAQPEPAIRRVLIDYLKAPAAVAR